MGLKISFELDDEDLEHFRLIMLHARDIVSRTAPEEIVANARSLLQQLATLRTPGFVAERLAKLQRLLQMISDIEWQLPHTDVKRVLNALAYFTDPDDLIPDTIPGLGYLDDAIMIELLVRELAVEIEAYDDFCTFREQEAASPAKLAAKREELLQRMLERREQLLESDASQDLRLLE